MLASSSFFLLCICSYSSQSVHHFLLLWPQGPSRSGTCLEKEVMWSCTSHSCEEPQSGYCFTPGMWFRQWRTFATSVCPPIEQIASENATKEFFATMLLKKHFGSSRNISVNSSKKNHFLHISRRFYPKRLKGLYISGYTFFVSMCVPWESNPQPLRCKRNALPLSHRNTFTNLKNMFPL